MARCYRDISNILVKKHSLLPLLLLPLAGLLFELSPSILNPALVLALPAAILGLSGLHADSPGVALGALEDQIYLPRLFNDKIKSSSELMNRSLD